MSNFRLNAKKPKSNAGLPTPKSEIYLLYREDIISMPTTDEKGVLTTGEFIIKAGKNFHILYTTPSTQTHHRETEGDVDSRGWKKKIVGFYPGDELEINEFVKNNVNQGFIALVKSCTSGLIKIYGSVNNPLYFTGSFIDDSEHKGYDLTFEQTFPDATPVLFYQGNIIEDNNALDSAASGADYSSVFVKIDASNLSAGNISALKKALGIGSAPTSIPPSATVPSRPVELPDYSNVFANIDGSNLTDENLRKFKEVLGVGETTATSSGPAPSGGAGVTFVRNSKGDASFNKRVRVKSDGTMGLEEENELIKSDLIKAAGLLSERERTTFLRTISGDNQIAQLRIHDILDALVLKDTKPIQVILVGSNFNFDISATRIFIINTSNASETQVNYTILKPISIAIDIEPTQALGTYKIKILANTGQATISTATFDIVEKSSFQNINISSLTWSQSKNPTLKNDTAFYDSRASGSQVNLKQYKKALGVPDRAAINVYKSSAIPNLSFADNFIIEGIINVDSVNYTAEAPFYFGITGESNFNYLSIPLYYVKLVETGNYGKSFFAYNGELVSMGGYPNSASCNFKIIKKGNIIVVSFNASASNGQNKNSMFSGSISLDSGSVYFMVSETNAVPEGNRQDVFSFKDIKILSVRKFR